MVEDKTPPDDTQATVCRCYVTSPDNLHLEPCPVHGFDRSETLDRGKKPERVVNTTSSLRSR